MDIPIAEDFAGIAAAMRDLERERAGDSVDCVIRGGHAPQFTSYYQQQLPEIFDAVLAKYFGISPQIDACPYSIGDRVRLSGDTMGTVTEIRGITMTVKPDPQRSYIVNVPI